jgi:mRNA interferase HigB
MRVISRKKLVEFWEVHAEAEPPLRAWFSLITSTRFENPHQVKQAFGSVDFLGGHTTVFDIGGNKYRLVVDMRYDLGAGRVYVRHVVTHAEYDRLSRAGRL